MQGESAVIELLIGIAIGVALRQFWPQEKDLAGKAISAALAKIKAKLGLK
jgi:hypothetical protein